MDAKEGITKNSENDLIRRQDIAMTMPPINV